MLMKTLGKFTALFFFMFLILSCESRKNIVLFQNIEELSKSQSELNNDPIIQVGDLLNISVSAIDMEAVKPFNLPVVAVNNISGTVNGVPKQQGYLVLTDNSIIFPIIGKVNVGGKSIEEVRHVLTEKLKLYVKSPIVNINIINFKITILGEVKTPGTYPIENQRVSLLQAIGMAGGLNIQGKRNNILVIREENGQTIHHSIDLRKNDFFNSDYYFLKQNDVVYIEPNKTKINSSKYGPAVSVSVSIASVIITLISVLTR